MLDALVANLQINDSYKGFWLKDLGHLTLYDNETKEIKVDHSLSYLPGFQLRFILVG